MTNKTEEPVSPIAADVPAQPERRVFLGKLGKTAAAAAALAVGTPLVDESASVSAQTPLTFYQQRALASFQYRMSVATDNNLPIPANFTRPNNGDELLYPNGIGSYSKGLPHNSNGEVDPVAYAALLDALRIGKSSMFEQIPLGGDRRLTDPQAGLAFDVEGADCFTTIQPPPPAFASREIAAELAENYWMALLRDVPFTQYTGSPIAQAAAADLNLFDADFKGPKNASGEVTPNLLFRGLTPGDRLGPYMSQFWYMPCFFGANEISQKIRTVLGVGNGGTDYVTDFDTWLSVQTGVSPSVSDRYDSVPRYIRNGRDIGQWVHTDVLFQGYFQAFLVLAGTLGAAFDTGNPYANSTTQAGFGTFGGPHLAAFLCEVATRALKAVWNQKWFVHRRLRPEVYAERVDRRLYHSANYPVHPEILTSLSTASRLGGYIQSGNAFLPMAFPEGSPTHPAYGAGHGTVAGACVTVLKAWFDEDTVIQDPVVPDPTGQVTVPYRGRDTLTVGGELNKIASNIAIGRNIAGVHWRSDATESLILGESVALSVMRDQKRSYNESFDGFSLTKFDGTTIRV